MARIKELYTKKLEEFYLLDLSDYSDEQVERDFWEQVCQDRSFAEFVDSVLPQPIV